MMSIASEMSAGGRTQSPLSSREEMSDVANLADLDEEWQLGHAGSRPQMATSSTGGSEAAATQLCQVARSVDEWVKRGSPDGEKERKRRENEMDRSQTSWSGRSTGPTTAIGQQYISPV